MNKQAFATVITGTETDFNGYDSIHGVETDIPSVEHLSTQTNQVTVPESRIGDHIDVNQFFTGEAKDAGLPTDAITNNSISPEELAAQAQKTGLPHIFDHGVVGQLAERVYDSVAQVQKYIPKLESGLDHTGRILFLMRYKPTDFEEAYGQDTLAELEQELSAVFKSQGALVLRLLRKFPDQQDFSKQVDV